MHIPNCSTHMFHMHSAFFKKNFKVWSKLHTKQGLHCNRPKLHLPSNSQNRHPVPKYHISLISTEQFKTKCADGRHDLPTEFTLCKCTNNKIIHTSFEALRVAKFDAIISGWQLCQLVQTNQWFRDGISLQNVGSLEPPHIGVTSKGFFFNYTFLKWKKKKTDKFEG